MGPGGDQTLLNGVSGFKVSVGKKKILYAKDPLGQVLFEAMVGKSWWELWVP